MPERLQELLLPAFADALTRFDASKDGKIGAEEPGVEDREVDKKKGSVTCMGKSALKGMTKPKVRFSPLRKFLAPA